MVILKEDLYIIKVLYKMIPCLIMELYIFTTFYTPVSRRAVLCDWVWRAGGQGSTQVSSQ